MEKLSKISSQSSLGNDVFIHTMFQIDISELYSKENSQGIQIYY
jgi:hypothetical protein